MANLIQIKRSLTAASPGSLANGELAFTSNGDVLFVGANGAVEAIGGKRNPGVLTANQALVANATSYIDAIKVANATLDKVYANGTHGTAGYVLATGGSGANAYWVDPATLATSPGGSNTYIQYNDSGALGGSAGFTYNESTNNVFVANTLTVGTATVNSTFYSGQSNTALVANNSTYAFGKTEGNLNVNSALIANSASYLGSKQEADLNVNNAVTANSASYLGSKQEADLNVNSAITSNNSTYAFGKSESGLNVNNALTANSASYLGSKQEAALNVNSALTANLATYIVANSGLVSNSSGVFVNANTGVVANSSGVFIGQSVGTSDNVTFNDITINGNTTLGNATSDIITPNALFAGSLVPSANVTYDLGTTTKRWKDLYLSGTTIYLGGTTLSDTSGTLSVTSANITADFTVTGNTKLGDSSSDVVSFIASVNTNITPSANVTYNLGTNLLRWNEGHFANIHSTEGYFDGKVQISGDLIVTGNVTTTNVASVVISDPLIYLAGNNYSSDLVDIGFAGNYNQGGTNKHTGLFRDASVDQYYLFKGLTQELSGSATVNTADPTFAVADLNAYLVSGGLVSNGTNVAITANSTLDVAIVANTLTLSTPLAATSGGTGYNSYTTGDILTAANSSTFSKLGLGTDGYVLQSNGSALVYASLDGGSF